MKRILFFTLFFFLTIPEISAQKNASLKRGNPEAEGISSKAILNFLDRAEKEIDALHSYMIVKNGKVVSEGWWSPYNPHSPHQLYSLSKGFISTAIGFAVQEGLFSIDDIVISFFPDDVPENPNWNLKNLRIRDLLTMSTGHIESALSKNDRQKENWVKAFLAKKIELMPGSYGKYNSPASYMLSAIIQKTTGQTVVDYLKNRFFIPLGIQSPEWDTCPRGINIDFGMHLNTEDIAKFGQFYLKEGMWNNKQLLSKEWIHMATSKQVSNGSLPDNDFTQGFGFQFWMSRHNSYRADGMYSQYCLILPDHEMVIAITSGAHDMQKVLNVIWETILPPFENKKVVEDSNSISLLRKKNNSLSLKYVISDIEIDRFKKNFSFQKNTVGVKSIIFNFNKNKHQIKIEMDDGQESIIIGNGEFLKSELQNHLPYTKKNGKGIVSYGISEDKLRKISTSGGWINNNEYKMISFLYETTTRVVYNFIFEGKKLIWKTFVDHALYSSNEIQILKSI